MTGLEKILGQISDEAEQTARQHLQQAQQQVDEVMTKTDAELASMQEKHEQSLADQTKNILERAQSAADLEGRKQVLQYKQGLINQTVAEAKQTMQALSVQEYFSVLLTIAGKAFEGDQATMALGANDLQRLPRDFAGKLPAGITLSDTPANIENGFVLIMDGIDINCSFEALFDDKAEQLQDKTASILFR